MLKKKITITNAYTWYNKGDSGILLSTVDTLKKIYGKDNLEINVLSFTPEEDKKRYCQDKVIKNVYSNILNPHPYKKGVIGKGIAIIKLFFYMIYFQLQLIFNKKNFFENNEICKVLNESDMIIVCGGGFLGGKKFDSLMHVYQIYLNTQFGKPVYIMGNSIEPIKKQIIKYFTEKVLKKVDFIFVRETITEEYVSTFMDKNKYTLIPDMAFMLEDVNRDFEFVDELRKENELLIGTTVRSWNFPNLSNKIQAKENYENSVRDMMVYMFNKYNCSFVFIPQVTVSTGDDTLTALRIKNKLPENLKNKFIIRTDDWSPSEIKSVIKNMDYFVGTRMHSNIFATSMCVPTTAIAYEKKTNGIMETVNLSDYVVEIDTITKDDLIDKVENMIENDSQIRELLKSRIKEIRLDTLNRLKANMEG